MGMIQLFIGDYNSQRVRVNGMDVVDDFNQLS
jgi:hypothetical protein